jgi:hypothetical protein
MKMKLFKMLPFVGLMLSVTATSAFAVGKDSIDDTTGKMCQKLTDALIKKDRKTASARVGEAKGDADKAAENSSSAL